MTSSLDLILLPLVRRGGVDQPELPGLLAVAPPRRPARGRALDQLILHLALDGNAPLSAKGLQKLLESLVQTYYQTPGSSTAAMRNVADSLNEYLLQRNERGMLRGLQAGGLLTLAVLRGSSLYLAQSGPTHAFLFNQERVQYLYDLDAAGPGLGRAKVAVLRYHQAVLAPGDLLLLTAAPPPAWTPEGLRGAQKASLEALHRGLLRGVEEVEAALIRAEAGAGRLRWLHPEPLSPEAAGAPVSTTPAPTPDLPEQAAEPETPSAAPVEPSLVTEVNLPVADSPVTDLPVADSAAQVSAGLPKPELAAAPAGEAAPRHPTVAALPSEHKPAPPKAERPAKTPRKPFVGAALLALGRAFGNVFGRIGQAIVNLLKHTLPDEGILNLPGSLMALIAVAVPVAVVTVAMVVYIREGRTQRHLEYLQQAQQAAEQATSVQEPDSQRVAWEIVVGFLDQAEAYQVSEESSALRAYAYTILDDLDLIERLAFAPALVEELPAEVKISRMVATTEDELYLLDGVAGNVYRTVFNGQQFQVDTEFVCGPIPQPLIVGPLVDIVALPLGDPDGATIMGMDDDGNLLKCIPGGKPPLAFQLGLPDTYWGEPLAFELDDGDLYVLDPLTNAVWIYRSRDGYRQRPQLFFSNQVPPMADVFDLAVIGDDLFLLHEDSHLTKCTFSGYIDAPTRCTEPAVFQDARPGRAGGELIEDAAFAQLASAPPHTEPSIYLFDPFEHAIYRFSLLLALDRQYRPYSPLPDEPATAFTISPNRLVFIAIGNQVWYATY
jgi:hypothetical protein